MQIQKRIKRLISTRVIGGGSPNLDAMTLEQVMTYLFDVAYWPMTEAEGNALDHKNNFDITWSASGVTRADYALPNGDKIPSFDGTGQGTLYSAALAAAFPYNTGSIMLVQRVPDTLTWEAADGNNRYLWNFRTTANEMNYGAKSATLSAQGYRNSNGPWNSSGMTQPAVVGITWDTGTGLLKFYTNGEEGVTTVGGQVAYAAALNTTYTRIAADTTFGTNKWLGQIGHMGISKRVLTAAQFKTIFNKIVPSSRKFFIIGDSKSTGANFWPGYLANLLNTATGDYWTDGPRRYALGGYDITAMKAYAITNGNLALETETPEFILMNMGTNDARAVTITDETVFKTDYTAVIDACRTKWPGVPIFLQHVYRADSAQTITNSGIINGYIDAIVASYATGVYAGPADDVYIENGDAGATYLTTDHIHYSVAAHAQVATQWFNILDAAGLAV